MTLLGALLGQIPWVRDNVTTMLLLISAVTMTGMVIPMINRARRKRREKKTAEAAT